MRPPYRIPAAAVESRTPATGGMSGNEAGASGETFIAVDTLKFTLQRGRARNPEFFPSSPEQRGSRLAVPGNDARSGFYRPAYLLVGAAGLSDSGLAGAAAAGG